jgi:hypothetical protein
MSPAIPSAQPCCNPCSVDGVVSVQVPGPAGADGIIGTDGTDGINAYTLVTTGFVMPAEGANVSVQVLNTSWMGIGQTLFVETAKWMQVVSITTGGIVVLKNLKNTGTNSYLENPAPGTAIPAGTKVSPGGLQGVNATSAQEVFSGHYGGSAPGVVPGGTTGVAVDLDAPNQVWYWNSDSLSWI